MSEQEDRLVRCFTSAFPTMSEAEIRASDVGQLFNVDSFAGVTLVTLIEEEFNVTVDLSELLELGSFDAISQFLRGQNPSSRPPQEREVQ
jgi:acyl carrier protein